MNVHYFSSKCILYAAAPDSTRPIRLAGAGRGEPKLNGPPSVRPPPGFSQTDIHTATGSATFNVNMQSGKASQVNGSQVCPGSHKLWYVIEFFCTVSIRC